MTVYYCDSSVLIKRHINEAGSLWFRELAHEQNMAFVTTQISIVEVCSALNRRLREGHINASEYQGLLDQFVFLCRSVYSVVPCTQYVIERSCSILERQPLRILDAVHLATALIANEQLTKLNEPELVFLASDHRLLAAALAEGLPAFNPAAAT
ncbi:MAG: type II toxin-antitoxin system VapC family toxin [Caldilineaceae bacterium]|nr:type II toxin-antitoxin system VapC family toxin [Caldilineaceae bacterium]